MTSARPTIPEVVDKLAAQGDADSIALFLEGQGVTGSPFTVTHCAVAEYVWQETGVRVCASYGSVRSVPAFVDFRDRTSGAVIEEYKGLVDFIGNFDSNKYPNLIREEWGNE